MSEAGRPPVVESVLEPVVEIEDLHVRRGDWPAVSGLDLTIEAGRITALVGPSGCGKTTLLRAIAGFETPAAGTIRLAGETVSGPGAWVPPERRQVGMVFQEGALFPHLDVARNLRYGVRGLADAEERVRGALELVGLEGLDRRMPDELSGGQQQRVALARALAPSPRLILLDEPFAGLDATLRERVRQEVREILERAGLTAVLVTHDQEEALSVGDRVAVMIAGRVLQVGDPEEIYHRPATPEVAEFIGVGQLIECEVADGRCSSIFGWAPCEAGDGRGRLFVRPEDFRLLPAGDGEGVAGKIVERRFFGHDVLDRVELDGGQSLEVRSLSSTTSAVGEPVRVALRQRIFQVFATPDGS
jgi:iron(III) transport system ATP-binding protein